MVFDLRRFVKDCEDAGSELNCADYVTARLKYELNNPVAMTAALPRYDDEEVLLHADDNITLFLIQLSPNVMYPPHNHNIAATIALCHGSEIAMYYRYRQGRPERSVSRTYSEGEIVFLPDDAIHAVGNPGETRSVALHIYFGNLPSVRRNLWHPDSGDELPFTEENYFKFAKPLEPGLAYTPPDQQARARAPSA